MNRPWTLVVVVALAGCGGKTQALGPPEGPPVGTCSSSGGSVWSCDANDAEPSQDAGPPLYLSTCPPGVGSGSCTGTDQTVDTTNPQQPAHISNGDCLQCASNGLGYYWSCVSGSWEAVGVYVCQ